MRHAIYYAPPPGSTLHRLGSAWLGRDAVSDEPVRQPVIEGLHEVTAEPARYGFHATLKAPFALNAGMKRVELGDAVALIAAQMETVTIHSLELREIDGFLALVPDWQDRVLSFLGEMCVCGLDSFRAKPSDEELARRRATNLTTRQEQHLMKWGYPYVLDEFRFHMSLTQRLPDRDRKTFMKAAQVHFAPVLGQPIEVDALTVFAETRPERNFVIEERFPLLHSVSVRIAS
jgi:putative phosphonate metabolism protein